jgi:hypothetical protein
MTAIQDDGIELGRRQHERFAVEVDAEVSADSRTYDAKTRDLSRGGVCFVISEPLKVGSSFSCSLTLVLGENTFSEPLVLSGIVAWCTPTDEGYQIGAAFGTLDAEIRDYLMMFLNFLAEGVHVGEGQEEEGEEGDEGDEDDDEDDDEKGLFG